MDGKKHHLPHDVIEQHILSRLPVKSLLRFRSVCRQWKTTISDDPRFLDTHLRLSRNSPSSRLLILPHDEPEMRHCQFVFDEFMKFRFISPVTSTSTPPEIFSDKYSSTLLCHCDGLLLFKRNLQNDFVLWNPSNRTYKLLSYPYSYLPPWSTPVYGIYYDATAAATVNNYKVLIGNENGYAVFNCRNNSWSEMRQTEADYSTTTYYEGASLNGSIYFGSTAGEGLDDDDEDEYDECRCWIVCYDGRDGKLKNIREFDKEIGLVRVISSGNGNGNALYVFSYSYDNTVSLMKMEVGDDWGYVWSQLKQVETPPKARIYQDKILLVECFRKYKKIFVGYDSYQELDFFVYDEDDYHILNNCDAVLPSMENLVLLNT